MNIYAGNLSYELTEDDLREAFAAYGEVDTVNIIMDQYSGRSKGFGFIEMPDDDKAMAAIEGLHDQDLKGRKLNVNKAKPRADRSRSGGGSGGGGGGGGGGRGRY